MIRSEKRRIKAFGDDFGDAFDGRLEYQRPQFILFYNTKYDAFPHDGKHHPRVNFTIAHELGHFFLTAHHDYLKHGGKPHGSRSEFVSDNNSEREADAFASGLLLPGFMFKPRVNTGELTLDRLDIIASEFETSLLSTVIRAVRVSDIPCAVAGIREDSIAWIFPSNPLIEGKIYPGKLAHWNLRKHELNGSSFGPGIRNGLSRTAWSATGSSCLAGKKNCTTPISSKNTFQFKL